ncbi:MAG: hypothetical protein WAW59_06875 [Patescibacteria group bacterium]
MSEKVSRIHFNETYRKIYIKKDAQRRASKVSIPQPLSHQPKDWSKAIEEEPLNESELLKNLTANPQSEEAIKKQIFCHLTSKYG